MASPTLQNGELVIAGEIRPVFRSEPGKTLMRMVERVAGSPATVLIQEETGTGKELIARAVHHLSQRRDKPLIDVNCAALPEHLIESELFGHEKGAFSGADAAKSGLFEVANGGTLFFGRNRRAGLQGPGKIVAGSGWATILSSRRPEKDSN